MRPGWAGPTGWPHASPGVGRALARPGQDHGHVFPRRLSDQHRREGRDPRFVPPLFANYDAFVSDITAIHPAVDSAAVCVEYTVRAQLTDGTEYTNDNIAVFVFEDGLIREYHDYFDPRRFQTVVDALAQIEAAPSVDRRFPRSC